MEELSILDFDEMRDTIEKSIGKKTLEELKALGYEVELQCESGTVAYLVSNDTFGLIGLLGEDGTISVDYDSVIYITKKRCKNG